MAMEKNEANNQEISLDQKEVKKFKKMFEDRVEMTVATFLPKATDREKFRALCYAVRDMMIKKWIKTQTAYYDQNPKRVYYLSFEFLMGRALGNSLINLNMEKICKEVLGQMGLDLNVLEELEWDAGLGNGGLGRLASCFLDSLATLNYPAYGYGIYYQFGMFKQVIRENKQREVADTWQRYGYPFTIEREEDYYRVRFGGEVHSYFDVNGHFRSDWVNGETVLAMANDIPIPGYQTENVNTLRLWSAKATREFNLHTFGKFDYLGAVLEKNESETISKVLYPNDNEDQGKELRFKQQYFMVSATIQDILRRFQNCGDKIENFHEKAVIHLNDTHPTLAIPELMRILLDHYDLSWEKSWGIVTKTFAFTNHTVLPEALEEWPVEFFSRILPRHLEIIYEVNSRFLEQVAIRYPGDFDKIERMSIIREGHTKKVRMAHLAIVGSFSVNGVAEIHTNILKDQVFKEFYQFYGHKFNNKTNGVTPRRWIRKANPALSKLISNVIGKDWISNLEEIKKIEEHVNHPPLLEMWHEVKRENKKRLAKLIANKCGVKVNPDSLFDVQVKRIHEYKRQLLNVLHGIHLYHEIRDNPNGDFVPRTIIFGGKAAPGYHMAKLVINLINSVANVINNDPVVGDRLKIAFIPNYGVSLAEIIIPGADLSEQISTAGYEASGTGNMKFAMNGALTIGTLDGANIEMLKEVGDENIFIFGNTEEQIRNLKKGGYNPKHYVEKSQSLMRILNSIKDGFFAHRDRSLFNPIYDAIVNHGDTYFLAADFDDYIKCQERVNETYKQQGLWSKMSVYNAARMGKFSSDRVIREYANEIWNVKETKI